MKGTRKPDPGGNRVEIEGSASTQTVKVDGHMLACSKAVLDLDAGSLPVLTVTLPVIDGLVISLDSGVMLNFAEETRAALVAAGWAPPPEPGDG